MVWKLRPSDSGSAPDPGSNGASRTASACPAAYERECECAACGEQYLLFDLTDDPDGPVMFEPMRCDCGGRIEPTGAWRTA